MNEHGVRGYLFGAEVIPACPCDDLPKEPTRWCAAAIDGPPTHRGSRVVAWRKRCRNKTRHPSGYCAAHRYRHHCPAENNP